jgi:hypothetical protein
MGGGVFKDGLLKQSSFLSKNEIKLLRSEGQIKKLIKNKQIFSLQIDDD